MLTTVWLMHPVTCLATVAYVYANAQYVLLFLVLVLNSDQFQI